MIIAPLFTNTYRYSLRALDTFYQIPKNKKVIRYANNLTVFLFLLVAFSLSYWLAVMILTIRQGVTNSPGFNMPEGYAALPMYHFQYYLLAYLFIILTIPSQFFVSYYLITRSNNFFSSFIILVLGEVVMIASMFSVIYLIYTFSNNELYILRFGYMDFSAIFPIALSENIFRNLIVNNKLPVINFDVALTVELIISAILYVAISALAIFKFVNEKESSGEYSRSAVGRDKLQRIISHAGFAVIGLLLASFIGTGTAYFVSLKIILFITGIIQYAAIYYVFIGLLNRNFKIKKNDLIPMIIIVLTALIIGVINNSFLIV